jgi:hypothetical protein
MRQGDIHGVIWLRTGANDRLIWEQKWTIGLIQGEKFLTNLDTYQLLKTFSGVSCYLSRYQLDRRVIYEYIRREIPQGHRKSNLDLPANWLRHIGLITNKRDYPLSPAVSRSPPTVNCKGGRRRMFWLLLGYAWITWLRKAPFVIFYT